MSYKAEEIEQHNKRSDAWITIDRKVYDVTKFIEEHPGGEETILENAGSDATDNFNDIGHSEDAKELLKKFYLGELEGRVPTANSPYKVDPISKPPNTQWLVVAFGVLGVFVAYMYLS
ncbi:hypothetical protein BB561_003207 [Smittium simulii]|uniref:Cytochrome b5 heme-binding domain-containing protein n=1 Tax=Smittium simulii TaxID=133385 RepID=A0A2T9Y0Z6_9FUNG|nr:hypothetical protein BB561_006842 [Smittium simulii]PVU93563.1 hypothetical protein BB561_003207 [Smittium simulii]